MVVVGVQFGLGACRGVPREVWVVAPGISQTFRSMAMEIASAWPGQGLGMCKGLESWVGEFQKKFLGKSTFLGCGRFSLSAVHFAFLLGVTC